jgi:glutaminyl-peptide cyclotransferase
MACLLAAAFLAGCRPAAPAGAAADTTAPAAWPAFTAADGTNALRRVEALCALGPRDAGTPGAARAAAWIAAQLAAAGLAPRVDLFTNDTPSGPLAYRNVLTEWPPSHAATSGGGGWIVLLSHYDTKPGIATNFTGANDGGSSTGLLLELAAKLRAAGPLPARVLCAWLDGEECRAAYGPRDGLHGSRRLAAQLAAERRRVRAVILLDMVGDRDLTVTIPANVTPALALLALDAAQAAGVRGKFGLLDGGLLDDHQPFLDAGFPAVNLVDFRYGSGPGLNDFWHTPQDTPDRLSARSLEAVGRVVLEMLRRLD